MPRFTADCSRCCALCCIVPAYLAVQGFPFDKPAETPCRHLCATGGCAIHAQRHERGFGGCVGFDCHGAGQWVTAQFGGARWAESAATRRAMAHAYRHWLPRFEVAALLEAALPLVTESEQVALAERIENVLDGTLTRREALHFVRSLLRQTRR
jgi:hypothetical protein